MFWLASSCSAGSRGLPLQLEKLAHEPAEVFFQIRIAIAIPICVAISSLAWIQAAHALPRVRHPVPVRVPIRRALDFWVILPATHIVLRIRQPWQAGLAPCESRSASARLNT